MDKNIINVAIEGESKSVSSDLDPDTKLEKGKGCHIPEFNYNTIGTHFHTGKSVHPSYNDIDI
jgi:hypothetical protein